MSIPSLRHHSVSTLRSLMKIGTSGRPLLLIILGTASALVLAAIWSPVPMEYLFREPYSIGHMPLYIGLLSNIGALLWCCTIGICLFVHAIVRTNARTASSGHVLLFPAIFSTALLLDDVLMMHERVIGPLLPNGQMLTYLAYGFAASYFVIRYRQTLLHTHLGVLMLSIGLLGTSAGLDVLKEVFSVNVVPAAQHVIVEDGLKLMGIASWLYYFSHLARTMLDRCWRDAAEMPDSQPARRLPQPPASHIAGLTT